MDDGTSLPEYKLEYIYFFDYSLSQNITFIWKSLSRVINRFFKWET